MSTHSKYRYAYNLPRFPNPCCGKKWACTTTQQLSTIVLSMSFFRFTLRKEQKWPIVLFTGRCLVPSSKLVRTQCSNARITRVFHGSKVHANDRFIRCGLSKNALRHRRKGKRRSRVSWRKSWEGWICPTGEGVLNGSAFFARE